MAGAIACVVFDFDGVLVDSNAVKRDGYFRVFESYGRPDVVEHCLAVYRRGSRYDVIGGILERLHAAGVAGAEPTAAAVEVFAARYNDVCEDAVATAREREGAGECLAALSAAVPLYVNSATPEPVLRRIVERRAWLPFFRGVYGWPAGKVEILQRVQAATGVARRSIAFVGDSQGDLDAASAFGCRFVAVLDPASDFERPVTDRIDRLSDLPAHLEITVRAAC